MTIPTFISAISLIKKKKIANVSFDSFIFLGKYIYPMICIQHNYMFYIMVKYVSIYKNCKYLTTMTLGTKHSLINFAAQKNKLLVMKIQVPILNKDTNYQSKWLQLQIDGLVLWCLTPLSTIFQFYIVAVSFIRLQIDVNCTLLKKTFSFYSL